MDGQTMANVFSGKNLLSFVLLGLVTCANNSCSTYQRGKGTLKASSVMGEFKVYPDKVFASPAGQNLKADVFIPDISQPKSGFPVVLLIHGGGWTNGNKEQMTPIAERLARAGFAVVNISYRFAPTHKWPAQLEDCESALKWIQDQASVYGFDLERVATFGYSAGAHLALMLGYTAKSPTGTELLVKAVINGAGPVDLLDFPDAPLVKQLIGPSVTKNPKAYRDASPIYFVTDKSPPTFVYYGENDWIVDAQQNKKLLSELAKHGVYHASHEAFFGHIATFLFDEEQTTLAIKFLKRSLN